MHGGTVHAASPGEGRGSTFVVSLPLAVSHLDQPTGEAPAIPMDVTPSPTRISLRGVKVLAVDDEHDARNLIRRILERSSAKVFTAGSATEAMRLFKNERPDVIVSDIGMPEQDGYEFMRMVRSLGVEEGGQTPAAALTAYARPQDRRQALMAGYQSHVVKPADPDELITVVASLAGKLGRPV
jgi:CheY-like chemotaxis protein